MSRYATISVPSEVKELLERLKRPDEDWGTFLRRLVQEYLELKRREAFTKLTQLLTEEDLRSIEESMREFRKRFVLGDR